MTLAAYVLRHYLASGWNLGPQHLQKVSQLAGGLHHDTSQLLERAQKQYILTSSEMKKLYFGTLNKEPAYLRNIPFFLEIWLGQELISNKINFNKICTLFCTVTDKLHILWTHKTHVICHTTSPGHKPVFMLLLPKPMSFSKLKKTTLFKDTPRTCFDSQEGPFTAFFFFFFEPGRTCWLWV